MTILDKIVARKREEVATAKLLVSIEQLSKEKYFETECLSLKAFLTDSKKNGIIAEFKRQSPSKGVINDCVKPQDVVVGYQNAGVSALSILTDNHFFGGSFDDLMVGRSVVDIPVLRKDFMIDTYQVYEAKAIGASAILLIAAILTNNEAKELGAKAHELGLSVLMEVHNREELDLVNEYVDVVGVNNRDLKTFTVNLERSVELASHMPSDIIKISESGIHSVDDIVYLKKHGFSGFLIGENFMKQENPGEACKLFCNDLNKALLNI
ncbi:MAG: indole-3-glycerol phosphate synthase TrpC [Marinilabiliaceae bacterium]|nr:indole-3-glycerol phosphate synthase TrpC [Marinilabiliaceae bacterium]